MRLPAGGSRAVGPVFDRPAEEATEPVKDWLYALLPAHHEQRHALPRQGEGELADRHRPMT